MAVINLEVHRKYNELSQFETLEAFNLYYRKLTKTIKSEGLLTPKQQDILTTLFRSAKSGQGVCHMKYATLCKKAGVKSTSTIHAFLKVAKELGFLKNVAEVETVGNTKAATRRGGNAFTYFVFQSDTELVSSTEIEALSDKRIEQPIENRPESIELTAPTVEDVSSDVKQVFKQDLKQELKNIHTSYEDASVENESTHVVMEVEVSKEREEELVTISKEDELKSFGVPSEFYHAILPLGLATKDIVALYTKSIAKGIEQDLAATYPEQAKSFHVKHYLDAVKSAAVRTRFVINSNKGTRKEIRNVVGYFLRTLLTLLGEKFEAELVLSTLIECQTELESDYIDDSAVIDFAVLTLVQTVFRDKMDYEGVLDIVLNVLENYEIASETAA